MRERGPIGPRGAIPSRLSAPALLLATVVAALLQVVLRAYVTDDTFIHCVFARQLATQGIFGFNPGEAVYGDTSPLWVLVLAGGHRLGLDPVAVAKVLSASAAILLPVVIAGWCRRMALPGAAIACATVLVATEVSVARWGASGMETVCGTLGVIGALALLHGGRPRPAREAAIGLLLAGAALVRPEVTVLVGLALLAAAWGVLTGSMRLGAAVTRALCALGPLIAWWTYAWHTFGSLTPTTSTAKSSGLIGVPAQIWGDLLREGRVVVATEAVALVACAICVVHPRGLRRWLDTYLNSSLTLALLWAGAVLLGYAVLGYEIVSRYLVPVLPVLAVAGVTAACAVWAKSPRRGAVLVLMTMLAVAQNAFVLTRYVLPQVRSFSRGMETALIPAALWFRDHTPAGSVVALHDIGAVGYYGERPVLDLGGLVTPEITPLRRRMSDDALLRSGAFTAIAVPDYMLVRGAGSDSLAGRSFGGRRARSLFAVDMPNLGVTRPEPVRYTAYALDAENARP